MIVFLSLFAACVRPPPGQMEAALGTVCAVNLFERGTASLYSRIFSRIHEIDRIMGFHGETADALASGIAAINLRAGIEPVKVRADVMHVLETALFYAELSGGAFDPSIGPLVRLWDIGGDSGGRIPGEEEIAAALDLVNWQNIVIDREAQTVFLRREGMALDLGAIAKGYAADEAARIAAEAGVRRAIFDFGGDIFVLGHRAQGGRGRQRRNESPWRIGIQNPLMAERRSHVGVLHVYNRGIVTSGVYQQFFEQDGIRYHHILSPITGFPVDNGLLSVTVVASRSMNADALSTAAFVLGFEEGRALIDSRPDAEAIFIFDDNSIKATRGLKEIFTPAVGTTADEFVITFLE